MYNTIILFLMRLFEYFKQKPQPITPTATPPPDLPKKLPSYENPPPPPPPAVVVVHEQKPAPSANATLPPVTTPDAVFNLLPVAETRNSTVSKLLYKGKHLCYIIEDGFRNPKVKSHTRIPDGLYKIKLIKYGRFYNLYKKEFNHEFVAMIEDVPGYTGILIHIGNDNTDTLGCLCVGKSYHLSAKNEYFLKFSAITYDEIFYPALADAFEHTSEVFITINRAPLPPEFMIRGAVAEMTDQEFTEKLNNFNSTLLS